MYVDCQLCLCSGIGMWNTDCAGMCIIKISLTQGGSWKSSPPSVLYCKSLCYIEYTSTWLDVRSCVLMLEATTFNIFCDDISFQHLATVLISIFTLCYGPGLLFRGPLRIRLLKINWSCTQEFSSMLFIVHSSHFIRKFVHTFGH
jgi:hypothetical protein